MAVSLPVEASQSTTFKLFGIKMDLLEQEKFSNEKFIFNVENYMPLVVYKTTASIHVYSTAECGNWNGNKKSGKL